MTSETLIVVGNALYLGICSGGGLLTLSSGKSKVFKHFEALRYAGKDTPEGAKMGVARCVPFILAAGTLAMILFSSYAFFLVAPWLAWVYLLDTVFSALYLHLAILVPLLMDTCNEETLKPTKYVSAISLSITFFLSVYVLLTWL